MACGDFALTVPQMKRAAELYLEHWWSLRQIADSFSVSQTAVINALAYEGVKLREKHQARSLRCRVGGVPETKAAPLLTGLSA